MSVLFTADAVPAAEQAERWRELITGALGPIEPHGMPDWLLVGDAGAVQVGELEQGDAGGATRTRRQARAVERELFKVDVLAAGEGIVEQDGRRAHLRAGDLVLVDLTRPARWRMSASVHWIAVMFAPAMLPLARDVLNQLTAVRVSGREGPGALASAFLQQLPSHLDDELGEQRARLGTATLDLLTVALAGRLDRADAAPAETRQLALLMSVRAFIEERLGDADLSPGTIAAAHHVSVRYLHKLFEAHQTTVAAWVRARRLERCRRDMLDPAHRLEPVSAIATRWGLTNPAHFSRLFRDAYGAAPTEYRALADERAAVDSQHLIAGA